MSAVNARLQRHNAAPVQTCKPHPGDLLGVPERACPVAGNFLKGWVRRGWARIEGCAHRPTPAASAAAGIAADAGSADGGRAVPGPMRIAVHAASPGKGAGGLQDRDQLVEHQAV
jgi:hypothetical protein